MASNLSVCGRSGKQKPFRLLSCNTCRARFSQRKGTALDRCRLPEETAIAVFDHRAEDKGVRPTARLVVDHRRSQAIAAVQQAAAAAGKSLSVSFTLPVLPTGLTSDGLHVLQSALKYGVKIGTVNVMAMDFGDSAAPSPQGQMGTYAIDSAQSTHTQLAGLYGSALSSSQLWEIVGVTPLIGVNDVSDEVFMPADATQLVTFARQVGLGELSFWSLLRDREDPKGALSYSEATSSSIVQTPFSFSDILNTYTGS